MWVRRDVVESEGAVALSIYTMVRREFEGVFLLGAFVSCVWWRVAVSGRNMGEASDEVARCGGRGRKKGRFFAQSDFFLAVKVKPAVVRFTARCNQRG